MLEQEFANLINEFGEDVTFNEETRKMIVSTKTVNEDFDDREIHTDLPISRGEMLTYNNIYWLVISEVAAKRSYEYKAIIRPCKQSIGVITTNEKMVGTDSLGRPIYDTVETTNDIPAYVDWKRLSIEGDQIRLSDMDIDIVVQDNETTSTIAINDEFDLIDKRYTIQNVNKFKQGLLVLRAKIAA